MSRENMEFARRWVNRWNAGDPIPFPDEEIHSDVLHLHGRQKDIAFDFSAGLLAEIRDGRMVRLEFFVDNPAEAIEAAGLRE